MDITTLTERAGRFCHLELSDGFRAYVWVNAVDPSFSDHELNCDVLSIVALGSRSDGSVSDESFTVAATSVVRLEPAEDAV